MEDSEIRGMGGGESIFSTSRCVDSVFMASGWRSPAATGVRQEALAIRFSFPMWCTVSSARRDGIPKRISLRDAGNGRVQDLVARIVPDLGTESTALDDAVTPTRLAACEYPSGSVNKS